MNIVSTQNFVKNDHPFQGRSQMFLHKWQVYNSYIPLVI